MRASLRTALAAFALVVAGTGLSPAPATAAGGYCSGPGVNVAVDFGALGGGIEKGCAAGTGSRSAGSAFKAAGVSLTPVTRYPGAICRVEGRPSTSCTNMPPADAYWALFSSHGSGWTFSSQGVEALRVSSGDTVAFAWQAGSRHVPGTAPGAAAPSSTAKPSAAPTSGGRAPTGHASQPAPAGAGTASPSASPTVTASAPASTGTASPRARPRRAAAPAVRGSTCAVSGVSVVVDFHQLPGDVRLGCAPEGSGGSAWDAFGDAGVRLTELAAFAGGICRVDGEPAGAACTQMPAADAYWSLYVRKGDRWTYASKGAKALSVGSGDVVALSWQQGKKSAPPRLSPTEALARTAAPSPSATASAADLTASPTSGDRAADTGGGLPWEVPVGIIVVLALGAGAVLLRRRGTAG